MTYNHLLKTTRFIFFPAFLLVIFLGMSRGLLMLAEETLSTNVLPSVQSFKGLWTAPPQLILGFILFIIARHKPFEKVFKGVLIILISVSALLTLLIFLQAHFEPQGLKVGAYKQWPASLLYIVLSLIRSNFFLVFIWGFINCLFTLSDGAKYYIPLAIILNLTDFAALKCIYIFFPHIISSGPVTTMLMLAVVFLTCALIIFCLAWKQLPEHFIHLENIPPKLKGRFPFFSAAYLLIGGMVAWYLLQVLFNWQVKAHFSDFSAGSFYSQSVSYNWKISGITCLFCSIFWFLLGPQLILKKGWKTTTRYVSLSLLLAGIIWFGMFLRYMMISWQDDVIFRSFIMGTVDSLFFPCVQMLYLLIPYQKRFSVQIATAMLALPVIKTTQFLMIRALSATFGSLNSISICVRIIVLVLLLLLVFASKRASRFLPKNKEQPLY